MNLRPLEDRIIVEPAKVEEKTESGLYLAPAAQEKPQFGTVVAVGTDVKSVALGDTVVYSKYGGTEIEDDDITYLVMTTKEVLAVKETTDVQA